jgi:CRP/FNR family transcriptional regulator, cyclic AMP receptor protein
MDSFSKGRTVVSFKKGQVLFKQRDPAAELFIIKSGQVRVYKDEEGMEIDLDTVGPGAIVGEVAALDGGLRSASVVALKDTEAFIIPGAEFKQMTQKIPDWFRKIASILVQRLREADARIDRNRDEDKTPQVAAALSLISRSDLCVKKDDASEINLKTLENEVADLLGITYSELTAAFEKLQKQDLLRIEKGKAFITNREKLDGIATPVFKDAALQTAT